MNRSSLPPAVCFALTISLPSPTSAQICGGYASLERTPFQVAGSAAFNNNAKLFAGSFTVGSSGPLGNVAVGTTSYNNPGGSSLDLGALVGWQAALDPQKRFQMCPGVGLSYISGPNNINGSGVDYSETDFKAGVSAGLLFAGAGTVQVIPTAAFYFVNASAKLSSGSVSVSNTNAFGVLAFGIGFVFGGEITLQPSIQVPTGLTGAPTSYAIGLGINFGGGPKGKQLRRP